MPVQLTTDSGDGFRARLGFSTITGGSFDINDAGTQAVFLSDQDLGANPTNTVNVFLAETDGSAVSQITALTFGDAKSPGISGDGSRIIFTSDGDLTNGNPMFDRQIFSINVDGSNLTQVTTGVVSAEEVAFADNGSRIVWQDTSDPFGTNADGSYEIFAINIDGTGHIQLTASAGDSHHTEDFGRWKLEWSSRLMESLPRSAATRTTSAKFTWSTAVGPVWSESLTSLNLPANFYEAAATGFGSAPGATGYIRETVSGSFSTLVPTCSALIRTTHSRYTGRAATA